MKKREGISLREVARRDGCSGKLARWGIVRDYIKEFLDGSVDQKFIGSERWEAARLAGAMEIPADATLKPVRTETFAAAAILRPRGLLDETH